jgi:hypothetical protein
MSTEARDTHPARRLLDPVVVHYLTLAAGAVVLLAAAARGWFFYDDWAFLVPSQEHLVWEPHVGHWSTVPFLLFLGLRQVFGVDHLLPFAVPVIVAHLGFAHALWRFSRRVGVAPWIATAVGALIVFFGAGSENLPWAFQVGYIGAMALGMVIILRLLRPRLTRVDALLIPALSLIALASSGTALPLLLVAALIGWNRHGFLRTLALFAFPAAAYLAWYVLFAFGDAGHGRAAGIGDLLSAVPEYAIAMLTDGVGRAFPIAILGPLAVAATGIWAMLTVADAPRRARPAYVLFLAAPVFALLTAYSRVGLGIETATSSRYLYFVIPVMLPLMSLALTSVVRRTQWRMPAVVALIGIVVLFNAGGLAGSVLKRDARSADAHRTMSAVLALSAEYDDLDAVARVRAGGEWAPDVTVRDVLELSRRGWFSGGSYDAAAELSARAVLGVRVVPAVPPTDDCRPLEVGDAVQLPPDSVVSSFGSHLALALDDGKASGVARSLAVADGDGVQLEGPTAGMALNITLTVGAACVIPE